LHLTSDISRAAATPHPHRTPWSRRSLELETGHALKQPEPGVGAPTAAVT